jgi:dolichyl-phosphate-mannose--protein O-mannosyl transferase
MSENPSAEDELPEEPAPMLPAHSATAWDDAAEDDARPIDDESLEPWWTVPLYIGLVIGLGFSVFMINYWLPLGATWDEVYHVPSAYKYLDGVFFMEPHPPLGKQLIAIGELFLLSNPDADRKSLTTVERTRNLEDSFSMRGVRLMPALFAWASCVVFFMICLRLLDDPHLALMASCLYLFDNAMVMHFRKAMLDGFLCFFFLCAVVLHRVVSRPQCSLPKR